DWQVLALGTFRNIHDEKLHASSPEIRTLDDLSLTFPWDDFLDFYQTRTTGASYISRPIKPDSGPFANTHIMFMAIRSLRGMSAPINSNHLTESSGVTFFVVDAMEIARRYSADVVSGRTGYPWVLDGKGRFMYHVENDFSGKDSFTVREQRNSDISYEKINLLTREKLLTGKEGSDWYISGWHGDETARLKKLLAYSPVIFTPEHQYYEANIWSVGIAAPEGEVYGLIQPIVIRQWTVAGFFLFIVISALLTLYLISLRWNKALTRKVMDKTAHLTRSQELLRKEKEKVEQSINSLMETQQKLVESERFAAIGEAAAHLSHEIKNPLMLMAGFANQVSRSLPEDDSNQEKLRVIADEAKRLEKMLIQVRDFTRPQQPKKKTGQINELIMETYKLVQSELDMTGIKFKMNLDPDLPPIKFDKSQMKQVLINLLKNAWEAMPDGGTLSVTTKPEEDGIKVIIEDTGIGIPQDKMEKIFSPFFTTKDKGTGLGLAVIYRIIQEHNGEVSVSSNMGKGSTFT
ncbi:MAG: ATP-binding protein, partial [Desulfonatronovibrio sp.]